jgi:hypothetical protein
VYVGAVYLVRHANDLSVTYEDATAQNVAVKETDPKATAKRV